MNCRGSGLKAPMNTNRDPRASGASNDPRNAQNDPRGGSSDPRSGGWPQADTRSHVPDPMQTLFNMANIKSEPKAYPEPTIIYSQEGSVGWKLREVTLEKQVITTLPTNIHPMDPRLPKLQQEVIKCSASKPVKKEESKPKVDPRLLRQNSRSGESPQQSESRISSDPRSIKSNDPRCSDPRTARSASGTSPEHSEDIKPNVSHVEDNSMPVGLKIPPPLERQFSTPISAIHQLAVVLDPKNTSRQNSMPEPLTAKKDPRAASRSNSSDSDSSVNKLSYRNDPRFKKKPKSESGFATISTNQAETEVSVKQESEEKPSATDTKVDSLRMRRGNLDHSSPLGGHEVEPNKTGENSYSAYNRPKDTKPNRTVSRTVSSEGKSNPSVSGLPSEEGVTFVPPPLLVPELPVSHGMLPAALEEQPPPLKDVFSTMDPTASPFC